MPVAEIAAAISSANAALNIAKAMVGLRDSEVLRANTIELQSAILDYLNKAIEAREAHFAQENVISALKAEIASLKEWNAEKEQYELAKVGRGAMAFMLKPEARGSKPPHWLCPTCFEAGKKSYFQPSPKPSPLGLVYDCVSCKTVLQAHPGEQPKWQGDPAAG